MTSADALKTFIDVLAIYQRGDVAATKSRLTGILAQNPLQADAQHLSALIARQEGRWLDALQHFEWSLKANPGQPVVLSNLGNLLRDLRRDQEAEDRYRSAIELMPTLVDAWYHRGILAADRYQYALAIECLSKAIELKPEARSYIGLGRAHLSKTPQTPADARAAIDVACEMRRHFPSDVRSYALEARALIAATQIEEAESLLRDALPRVEDPAALHYELALLCLEQLRVEEARAALETAVSLRAEFIEAHRALNNLLWERREDGFLSSYHTALKRYPNSAPLYHNLAAAYISSGSEAEATRTLEFAVERLGRDPFLLHGLGVQAVKHGNLAIAREFYDEALRVVPDSVRFLVDRATLSLQLGDYEEALMPLERAVRIAPHHQEVWGYLGLLWRLTDDPRYEWLYPYDQLLREFVLPMPEGFDSLAQFMSALAAVLQRKHITRRQPLDQSVRHGTQTVGVLLDEPDPIIQALRRSLVEVVDDYLGSLPQDDNHPFLQRLRRPGRAWHFAGSWSVSLGSQGFHTNHVHPFGWLSCCLYVAVPESIRSGDDRAGWIRFGETSLDLGDRGSVARAIAPRVGHGVFFPSYFWHGTYPFTATERRITVPFDIDPL